MRNLKLSHDQRAKLLAYLEGAKPRTWVEWVTVAGALAALVVGTISL